MSEPTDAPSHSPTKSTKHKLTDAPIPSPIEEPPRESVVYVRISSGVCDVLVEKTDCEGAAVFFEAEYRLESSNSAKPGGCIINKNDKNVRWNNGNTAGTGCGESVRM